MTLPPATLVRDPAAQLNFEQLLRLPRFEGPYDTGVTAALTPDGTTIITVTHNLKLTGLTRVVVVGHLYPGTFSMLATWRAEVGVNTVTIGIGNPSGRSDVQAGLRFYLLIPRT